MDIKAKAEELIEKIKEDPGMLADFRKNPIPVVEQLVGMDLPDDQILKAAELIKAKLDLEKAGDLLKGLGGLFGK